MFNQIFLVKSPHGPGHRQQSGLKITGISNLWKYNILILFYTQTFIQVFHDPKQNNTWVFGGHTITFPDLLKHLCFCLRHQMNLSSTTVYTICRDYDSFQASFPENFFF